MTDAEKKKASRAAEKAKREANNLKRSQDKVAMKELQTNLLEVVKLFHHLP
jgi:hypothetical protein